MLLSVETMLKEQAKELDKAYARAVYTHNLPLSLWELKGMKTVITMLHRGYKPPSRWQLSHGLLRECYQELVEQVEPKIQAASSLQLILDETTDINNERVMNLFINTPSGCFFKGLTQLKGNQVDASFLCNSLQTQIVQLVGVENLSKVTAFSTDTCSLMTSLWDKLEEISTFRNALFVPCESHSIQLLIKDLLELEALSDVAKQAGEVVAYFKRSPKQYGLLRQHQKTHYNKQIALIISVITRWGTQYRQIARLLSMRQALLDWSYDERSEGGSIKAIIQDESFWTQLTFSARLLKPIHDLQVKSESPEAHLGNVQHRWQAIKAHLTRICNDDTVNHHLQDDESLLWEIVRTREKRQVKDFHLLAFYLCPYPFAERYENRKQVCDLTAVPDISQSIEKSVTTPSKDSFLLPLLLRLPRASLQSPYFISRPSACAFINLSQRRISLTGLLRHILSCSGAAT